MTSSTLPLGEEGPDAERSCHFVRDQDAADGRRQHRLHPVVAERGGERFAEGRGVVGVLKHQR
jgi:hypothetical protein